MIDQANAARLCHNAMLQSPIIWLYIMHVLDMNE